MSTTLLDDVTADSRMKAVVDAKVRKRLLPILFIAALMCYLDRTNLSFAALDMNKDLAISPIEYGVGAGALLPLHASRLGS